VQTPRQANSAATAELLTLRLPSQDDSHVQLVRNPSAFAVSRRHALAGWEVQSPLWLERPAYSLSSAFHQRVPYALERPQGLAI
jgi:hypothetical protein